ncbi:MAG: glycosyltransferase [Acidimicrobiia bacterium]
MTAVPFVRVVVLNFDGGAMTLDCLDALARTDWPADRLEIVLVDNGSVDGVLDEVRRRHPQVRVLEPLSNLGFAGGCNLGIRAVGAWDYVALVNNDAVVEPGWLAPLVDALEADPALGAAAAKILFAERYVGVELDVPDAGPIAGGDGRRLGVKVTAVRIDGERDDARVTTDEGFHAPDPPASGEEMARWSGRHGALRIEVADGRTRRTLALQLVAPDRRRVLITAGGDPARRDPADGLVLCDVDAGPAPMWVDVPLDQEPFDVVNNVGSCLFAGGYGGDRGFLEPDHGQYDEAADVFAWCGGGVLLRRAYLDDVGLFDERLFLYYEDSDLSWRGQLRGWRYLYVPTSVIRHRHAASSGGPASPVFQFHVQRNRLLMLAKNAPARVATRAMVVWLRESFAIVLGDIVRPVVRLRRPRLRRAKLRVRVARSLVALLPAMIADRRRARPAVPRSAVMAWETSKDGMA